MKTMKSSNRGILINKAENLGWIVTECDDGSVEFRQFSPAGEDFGFSVPGENIVEEVWEYYEDFDPEQHAADWISLKNQPNGDCKGIPNVRTLIADADAIDDMLCELYCVLSLDMCALLDGAIG